MAVQVVPEKKYFQRLTELLQLSGDPVKFSEAAQHFVTDIERHIEQSVFEARREEREHVELRKKQQESDTLEKLLRKRRDEAEHTVFIELVSGDRRELRVIHCTIEQFNCDFPDYAIPLREGVLTDDKLLESANFDLTPHVRIEVHPEDLEFIAWIEYCKEIPKLLQSGQSSKTEIFNCIKRIAAYPGLPLVKKWFTVLCAFDQAQDQPPRDRKRARTIVVS